MNRHAELWPGIPYWWGDQVKPQELIRYLERMKSCGRPGEHVPSTHGTPACSQVTHWLASGSQQGSLDVVSLVCVCITRMHAWGCEHACTSVCMHSEADTWKHGTRACGCVHACVCALLCTWMQMCALCRHTTVRVLTCACVQRCRPT